MGRSSLHRLKKTQRNGRQVGRLRSALPVQNLLNSTVPLPKLDMYTISGGGARPY